MLDAIPLLSTLLQARFSSSCCHQYRAEKRLVSGAELRGVQEKAVRVRIICVVIIVGLLVVVALLSRKVSYLNQKCEQAQSEIKNLTKSHEDEILMIQISDGDERDSIYSQLWNVEAELRRCHTRRQKESH
jgi:hypothetical protein